MGTRNSSFGLATFRPDGLVGVQAEGAVGVAFTSELIVSGPKLVISADFPAGAAVTVGVLQRGVPLSGLGLSACTPLISPERATDVPVLFKDGKDLHRLIGQKVQLQF